MARAPQQPIEVPFGPLDTKSDPFNLPPGSLTTAENVTALQGNSYTGRLGYAQLTSGPAAAVAAVARGSEMALIDGSRLWSWDPNASVWVNTSSLLAVADAIPSRRPVARVSRTGTPSISNARAATVNGLTAVAWMIAGFPYIAIYDANGQVVYPTGTLLPTSLFPGNIRLAVNGNTLILFTLTSGSKVEATRCDTTVRPLAFSAFTTISTDVHATSIILDAVSVGANVVLLWAKSTGVQVGNVNPTTLALGTNTGQVAALNATSGGGITGTSGENVYAAWWDTAAGLKAWVLSTAIASVAGPTVIDSYVANQIDQVGLCRSDSTHAFIVWERQKNGNSLRGDGVTKDRARWCAVSSGAVAGTIGEVADLSLVSKPVPLNGLMYFRVLFDSTTGQSTTFLVRTNASGLGGGAFTSAACPISAMDCYRQATRDSIAANLQDLTQNSAGAWVSGVAIAVKYLSQDTAVAMVDLVTYDISSTKRFLSTQIGNLALTASGVCQTYDGTFLFESGFTTYPEGHTLTAFTTLGSMADGTYQYVLIYEGIDAFGNVTQSTTSAVKTVTVSGGGGSGRVSIGSIASEPNITFRQAGSVAGMTISIFRTAPSVSVGIFYHVTSLTDTPGAAVQNYTDTASDASISVNRQLYTTGNVLDKEPPLAAMQLITHQNALWGVSSEDTQLLFYSGDYSPGIAPWFSSGFQIRCDTGGAITAIASLDDKMIVFKSDRIFYVSGQRPNATGTNSSLSAPQLISSDVGCTEPRSIVRTSEGVYFLSAKGIYLIDRGLNVTYVGAPVEGYVQFYSNCVAATLLPDRQEIRWEFTGPISPLTVPRKIVYNYFLKRWVTHLNYNSLVPVTAVGGAGISYTWFTSDGNAYQELAASAQQVDPSTTFIPMTLEFGWLAPTGPQGLTRVQYAILLGAYKGAHGTQIDYGRNYGAYVNGITFGDAITQTLGTNQVAYNLPRQQGESFRFKISTVAGGSSGSYGQSMTATNLRLVALAKRGSFNKFMSSLGKG